VTVDDRDADVARRFQLLPALIATDEKRALVRRDSKPCPCAIV